jgi:prepilin-type N-terminal cleavage/methylation domain-containing protein
MILSIRKFWKPDRSNKKKRDHLYSFNPLWVRSLKRLIIRMFAIGDRMALRVRGFTLIELLVAMLLATLIISTMLAFTVNIMETDRREQARVETQGEVQASLDYIADDMQEAVYIYNADGLERTSLVTPPGISDQLPVFANSTPVLAFWKRIYYEPNEDLSVDESLFPNVKKKVGCLEYGTSITNSLAPLTCNTTAPTGSGRYTYSLVVYYLINDNQNGTNPDWSNAARIGRWEIKDGIRSSCQTGTNATTVSPTCAEPRPVSRIAITAATSVNYWVSPDPGFKPFNAQGADLASVMNSWTKTTTAYDPSNTPKTLLDLVDDTPFVAGQDTGTVVNPFSIAIGSNTTVAGSTTNANCADPMIGVGGSSAQSAQRVPSTFTVGGLSSFYVCVNSDQNLARIYLRGNAFARLRPNQTQPQRPINAQNNAFLSTSSIRAYGRGKVFLQ